MLERKNDGAEWGFVALIGLWLAFISGTEYQYALQGAEFDNLPIPAFDLLNFWKTPELYDDGVAIGLAAVPAAIVGAVLHGAIIGWREGAQDKQ